ncbi:HRDC domain-containing protein [Ruania halotolerans]|uniref:HRDC domain-containing protein n=1 Tax=Ruania halotolerans TaxID=2897773 RepID=UPI001E4E458B|nr:HRDC domain-containing protein [Ruania halotolerans]UFU04789.1 HRDC domain-containing protein [Ruania halotolerans]
MTRPTTPPATPEAPTHEPVEESDDKAPVELTPLREPAEGVPEVIETEQAFAQVVSRFASGSGPVAVDAERASGYRYGQRAYLVQLRRHGAGTALLDPQQLPDLSALSEVLKDTEWVLHAANQDLACLAEVNLVPMRLFDTELAGRLLGRERVGLGAMVSGELGLELAKEHSAADWSTRPLPQDWLRYAALDVEVLVELRDRLAAELEREGKLEWALEEFEAVRTAPPPPPRLQPWRRTSGSQQVRDGLGLAIVRELWQAREEQARLADISPGRLLQDAAIVAAATSKPATMAELAGLRPFRQKAAARRTRIWFEAVERARELDPAAYPSRRGPATDTLPPPRAWKDRFPEAALRLDAVRGTVRELAEQFNLPQENLLTPAFQRRLAWEPPHPVNTSTVAGTLEGLGARTWQVHLVAERLAAAISAVGE